MEYIHNENKDMAIRIGKRIRKIRKKRGLKQVDLGRMIDLEASRVQQYENGVRKPKKELLKKIATELHVNVSALEDPVVSNENNLMYTFFELEEFYDAHVVQYGDKFMIQFKDGVSGNANEKLKKWYIEKELKDTHSEYEEWKWNYQEDDNETETKFEETIHAVKEKIDSLQKILNDFLPNK